MKIALANVKYSPNLGDGLIADCLESALRAEFPDAQIVSIDIAGRTAYSADAGTRRGRALALLAALPPPARRVAVANLLRVLIASRYRDRWTAQLADCDRLILGGGQLLGDEDLNFPLKINALASLVKQRPITTAIFGVGVSRDWSASGTRLFRSALTALSPVHVAVRDTASAQNWQQHFNGLALPEAKLCRDPGLLAADVYPAAPRPSRIRPLAGLGVVHPHTLNLHTRGTPLTVAEGVRLWRELAAELGKGQFDVAFFTNGPADDEQFLDLILSGLPVDQNRAITRLPAPRQPSDLVRNIAACDAIAAHRLHANIAAFSYRIAHVGLGWDAKLPAFFESVGRGRYAAGEIRTMPTATIAGLLRDALDDPVPEDLHREILADARIGIRTCAHALA